MNVFKLLDSAKAYFKVVVRNVNNLEAIVFLVDPYYHVLNDICNVQSVNTQTLKKPK